MNDKEIIECYKEMVEAQHVSIQALLTLIKVLELRIATLTKRGDSDVL